LRNDVKKEKEVEERRLKKRELIKAALEAVAWNNCINKGARGSKIGRERGNPKSCPQISTRLASVDGTNRGMDRSIVDGENIEAAKNNRS
jgi:hypothetical protein